MHLTLELDGLILFKKNERTLIAFVNLKTNLTFCRYDSTFCTCDTTLCTCDSTFSELMIQHEQLWVLKELRLRSICDSPFYYTSLAFLRGRGAELVFSLTLIPNLP